jgi:hypothetical protein
MGLHGFARNELSLEPQIKDWLYKAYTTTQDRNPTWSKPHHYSARLGVLPS